MNRIAILFVLAASLFAAPLSAQGKGRNKDGVPPGHRPPPGMCRIWIDGVPPGQQPGPTDCATAVRTRPANSRVIFGADAYVGKRYQKGWNKKGKDRSDDSDDSEDREDASDSDDDDRDRRRRSDDVCVDRNRDGRCDEPVSERRTPSLPDMIGAILIGQGRRSGDVQRWMGDAVVSARYEDADRDGRPERATWLNSAGQIVQMWIDSNRDGRADIVRLYRDGRIVKVIE